MMRAARFGFAPSRLVLPACAAAVALALSLVACAPSAPAASSAESGNEIAKIHRSKCGACHVHVEPGERTRAELETALSRHRRRARLTEAQWSEMVDYLASR
jgi:hypothetical protein